MINISAENLHDFTNALLKAHGVDPTEADIITKALIWAEMVGRPPQGLIRLPIYLKRLEHRLIKSPCQASFNQLGESMWLLNGNDGFGHYLGHIAMQKAIDSATQHGLGLVGVNNSNHFGAGAYFVNMAAQQDKIGWCASNAFPLVAPFGGLSPVLGTNPFAFSAPTANGQAILIDLATSVIAGSAVRKAIQTGEALPENSIIGADGASITDSNLAQQGVFLPFGGAKGYALALMVEILCAVLMGAAISHEIASLYKNFDKASNLGHFFLAIDIARFMPLDTFYQRMEILTDYIKQVKTQDNIDEILLPGEARWRASAQHQQTGLTLNQNLVETLNHLAQQVNISPL